MIPDLVLCATRLFVPSAERTDRGGVRDGSMSVILSNSIPGVDRGRMTQVGAVDWLGVRGLLDRDEVWF